MVVHIICIIVIYISTCTCILICHTNMDYFWHEILGNQRYTILLTFACIVIIQQKVASHAATNIATYSVVTYLGTAVISSRTFINI